MAAEPEEPKTDVARHTLLDSGRFEFIAAKSSWACGPFSSSSMGWVMALGLSVTNSISSLASQGELLANIHCLSKFSLSRQLHEPLVLVVQREVFLDFKSRFTLVSLV